MQKKAVLKETLVYVSGLFSLLRASVASDLFLVGGLASLLPSFLLRRLPAATATAAAVAAAAAAAADSADSADAADSAAAAAAASVSAPAVPAMMLLVLKKRVSELDGTFCS